MNHLSRCSIVTPHVWSGYQILLIDTPFITMIVEIIAGDISIIEQGTNLLVNLNETGLEIPATLLIWRLMLH